MSKFGDKILVIEVNENNICQGIMGNGGECPVALALRDKLEEDFDTIITVDKGQISIEKEELKIRYDIPLTAKLFVQDFDKGKLVKPFTFKAKLQ